MRDVPRPSAAPSVDELYLLAHGLDPTGAEPLAAARPGDRLAVAGLSNPAESDRLPDE
jgi:hypothetical protein